METQRAATLTAIFSEVLTNLAFMFTEEEPSQASAGDSWLETVINYDGRSSGRLTFRCTREFAILLAANLLGIGSEDDDAGLKAEDAVREFMNIVCGQFVTAMYGSHDVFNLSIPQTRELSEAPDLSQENGDCLSTLSVDGHCVQLASAPLDHGATDT